MKITKLLKGKGDYITVADKKDWIYQYDWKKKKSTKIKLRSLFVGGQMEA